MRLARTIQPVLLALVIAWMSLASAQAWELRVCASPHDEPASSRTQKGYENQIAELIADELGAELTFVWVPYNDLRPNVQQYLNPGQCDMFMGVADGAAGMLSTVAYTSSPYVFAYRTRSKINIETIFDDILSTLRIATYPNSAIERALVEQGLTENLVAYSPETTASGFDYVTPIMRDVRSGKLDVALLYGPDISEFIGRDPEELTVIPVRPEIAPPMFQMFRLPTIGVRMGDDALRDRLNQAIVERWDGIQTILRRAHVPVSEVPKPKPPSLAPARVRVGVVLPTPTQTPTLRDPVSQAARLGAQLGEDLVTLEHPDEAQPLEILLASSPSLASAARAAERLIAVEGVAALIGGVGEAQAAVLANIAYEHGVPFLNIGSSSMALRAACQPTTFHIEASSATYLEATLKWFASQGISRWYIVYAESPQERALYRQARALIGRGDAFELVGTSAVEPDSFIYYDTLDSIERVAATGVLLLVQPVDQEIFLSQALAEDIGSAVVPFPYPETQTREFARRFAQASGQLARTPRVVLWDSSLSSSASQEVIKRFTSSSGMPMDPSAWAAAAAVKAVAKASFATDSVDADRLIRYLESSTFGLFKGVPLTFQADDHQLIQPLYLAEIDPSVVWQPDLTTRLSLVKVLGELPKLYNGEPSLKLEPPYCKAVNQFGKPAQR